MACSGPTGIGPKTGGMGGHRQPPRRGSVDQEHREDLGISRNTVRATLRQEGPPRYERRPAPSRLDAHRDYLIARFAEIRARGYAGGISILKDFTHSYPVPRKGWP